MDFTLSRRISGVQGSIIRELFKLGVDPNMISFGGGNPSAETFPVAEIAEIIDRVLKDNPISVLQYGLSEGYPPLREYMKQYLAKKGIDFENNDLLILSGAQQCCDLVTKALVNEGDVVLTEDPAFIGCLNTFRTYGAKLVGVPMEDDGMDLAALEAALEANPNAKLLYMIPNFQNPTGGTTSSEKRAKIYALCAAHGVAIYEDDPYGEIRFSGTPLPPIKAGDSEGIVFYAGSFSKVMAPAFRLGYLVFPKELLQPITVGKQSTDVHSNTLLQHVCYEYMTGYDFEGHLDKARAVYRKKCAHMLAEMDAKFHPDIHFTRPEGGLFIMAYLPDGMDAQPFVRKGIEKGVLTVPGVAFMADTNGISSGFRLNYSMPSDEQITRGIDILGALTHDYLAEKR